MIISAFAIKIFIHIVSMIVGFGAVIVIDTFGLLWIIKKVKLSQVNFVANITQKLIWIGWVGLVLSGTALLWEKGFIDNLTWIKLFFVALLGLNGIFLHFIKKSSQHLTDDMEMPALIRFRITLASTISQAGWWGALVIGVLHHEVSSRIDWPTNPFVWIISILLSIGIVALVGEKNLRK